MLWFYWGGCKTSTWLHIEVVRQLLESPESDCTHRHIWLSAPPMTAVELAVSRAAV